MVRYAVWNPGTRAARLAETWAVCLALTKGVKGVRYKKFKDRGAAEAFLRGPLCADDAAWPVSDGDGAAAGAALLGAAADPGAALFCLADIRPALGGARLAAFLAELAALPAGQSVVYTDGGCRDNGTPYARGGYGFVRVWSDGAPVFESTFAPLPVDGPPHTNNLGELLAAVRAVEASPPAAHLELRSDSRAMFVEPFAQLLARPSAEARARWVADRACYRAEWARLLAATARHGRVTARWVKGHAGEPGNEAADALATAGGSWLTLEGSRPDEPPAKRAKIK